MSIYKGNKLISGGSVDTHFVRKPAWSQAVTISAEQLNAGYTAPSDGMFVCTGVMPTEGSGLRIITVNDIVIATGQHFSSTEYSFGDCSCPVSKGDLIKASISRDACGSETRYFVPFENSTVSESDVEVVTPELIRNLQSPDWTKAVELSVTDLYNKGYNVPSNGIIVGYFIANPAASVFLRINNITVARASLPPETNYTGSEGNIQCPVNRGDHITLEPTSTPEVYKMTGEIHFVPYKAQ